jgi:hypothetical protein
LMLFIRNQEPLHLYRTHFLANKKIDSAFQNYSSVFGLNLLCFIFSLAPVILLINTLTIMMRKCESALLQNLEEPFIVRSFSLGGLHNSCHVLDPANVVFEQLLESQRAFDFDCLLFACTQPRYLELQ